MLVTAAEFLKNRKQLPLKNEDASCCHVLDVVDKEGNYTIDGKPVCGDCWYAHIGEGIDKHPLGRPTPHGGCC